MEARLEHTAYSVLDLVEDYKGGRLLIPEFQRDYVWKPSKAARLLDSLYRGFPISSLLVWESDDDVRTRRKDPRRASGARTRWLIDGQQRVITLPRVSNGDQGIDLVFDVKNEEFARANAATRKDSNCYRVSEVWDEEGWRRIRRNLKSDVHEKRLDRVRSILDKYKVPVVQMIGHSFENAVKSFKRINTEGVKLSKQDIESAQVAAKHSGFIRDEVSPVLHELDSTGFGRVDVGHLFRACAFLAHPDGRARTPLHELSTPQVRAAWERTLKGLREAQSILRNELGVMGTGLLSSGALLVPPIALCATTGVRERRSAEIAGWVALAALLHRYSGSSLTALEQDLRACRDDDPIRSLLRNLRQKRPHLKAEPHDFDAGLNDRGAIFGVYVACRHRGLIDVITKEKLATDLDIDRHHVFPRAQFAEAKRSRADVVPNIAFIKGESNKSLGPPSPDVYLRKLGARVLQSQCIPDDKALWELGRAKAFWARRCQLLAEAFNEFLARVLPDRNKVA